MIPAAQVVETMCERADALTGYYAAGGFIFGTLIALVFAWLFLRSLSFVLPPKGQG